MTNERDRRIAVIGAGIFGASTAAHLVARGADVSLVTEAAPASGASGRSLGWLNAFGDQPEAYVELRLEAIDRYRRFLAAHPGCDFVRFAGGVWWGIDTDETEYAYRRLTDRGYPVQLLTRADASATVKGLDADNLPEIVLYGQDEGWVELAAMVPALIDRFTGAGGTLITDAGRGVVEVADERVTGVTTERYGRLDADVVVVATGAAAPSMLANVIEVPDNTPNALLVRTRPTDSPLQVVVNSPRVALRPTPDGGLVVDHDWAARAVTRAADDSMSAPREVIDELLGEASKVLAGHPHLEAAELGIGPKPVPGDGLPVIGAVDGVDGCYVAFSHSGATLGLITGELLAAEIIEGVQSRLLSGFRPARFAERADR